MKPVETLIRYLITIDKLLSSQSAIPTQELLCYVNNEMEKRGFRPISLRTLQRDFIDIDIQFGYTIKSNGYEYNISRSPGYLAHHFDNILLDFDLLCALNSDAHLQQYVLAEHHRPIGSRHLSTLIRAIKSNIIVEFDYTLYRKDNDKIHKVVNPHFLKESNQRWYLLAMEGDTLKSFGVDRIENL